MTTLNREWKTEGEIEAIVHRIVSAEVGRQNQLLERFEVLLDKIADGAQAQILSANILHGNPAMGLKGAIPDLQERMKAVEQEVKETREVGDLRHYSNLTRLDRLEASQNRIRRAVGSCLKWAMKTDDGKANYTKIIGLGTIIGAALHWLLRLLPSWTTVKMSLMKIGILIGR